MPGSPQLGMKIKRARERLRMTQAQLGARVGKSQKTIDNWENGRRYPRSSIGALEDVLGVSLDEPADDELVISPGLRRTIDELTDGDPAVREWVMGELVKADKRLRGERGDDPAENGPKRQAG